MNTRTSLIAIGATLALIAPAASNARTIVNQKGGASSAAHKSNHAVAANTNLVSENGMVMVTGGKTTQTHKHGKTKTAPTISETVKPDVVYRAPFGPTGISTPHYIYEPGPAVPPIAYVDPNECQDNGTNCTAEQACTYWGESCNEGVAVPQEASSEAIN